MPAPESSLSSAAHSRADSLAAATGVVAAGAGVSLGGLAIAAASEGPIALIGAMLALLGTLVAGLAVGHVSRRHEIPDQVRAAYIVLVVAVGLGALSANLVLFNGWHTSTASGHQPGDTSRSTPNEPKRTCHRRHQEDRRCQLGAPNDVRSSTKERTDETWETPKRH